MSAPSWVRQSFSDRLHFWNWDHRKMFFRTSMDGGSFSDEDWEFSGIFALAKNTPAKRPVYRFPNLCFRNKKRRQTVNPMLWKHKLPKRILKKFSMLVGTLKRNIPAMDRGILFSDPTRLQNTRNQTLFTGLNLE